MKKLKKWKKNMKKRIKRDNKEEQEEDKTNDNNDNSNEENKWKNNSNEGSIKQIQKIKSSYDVHLPPDMCKFCVSHVKKRKLGINQVSQGWGDRTENPCFIWFLCHECWVQTSHNEDNSRVNRMATWELIWCPRSWPIFGHLRWTPY